jgi:eukaryotic-like serine/threonine-protein kinase
MVSNKGITAPDRNLGRHVIDQYILVEKIGEGGMGAVYLADQPTMGRRAVIKLLHPALSRDPQVAARFNLEARAAAALNHPHIVTVYNYGALPDGVLYLAMEHLDGRDLERAIEESGRLSPLRAVAIARQICDALGEAHARGVVHRDLKPSNVMLVTRGRDDEFVKVLDFGIAKVRGVALTSSGMVFGTPEYMSPEQLRGSALDGRSDLYSLGIVLFEMLTGRLPFEGETPEQFMTAHLETLPPTVTQVAPDLELPRELEALVARLLAKDAAARPATAEELSERLAAALGEAPSTAVGGKKSDPPGRARTPVGGREARLRAALVGAIVGTLALTGLALWLAPARVAPLPTPPALKKDLPAKDSSTPPAPATTHTTAPIDDPRSIDELEHEFLTMRSSLTTRDRRAAVRALFARIDAGGGSADERARLKHESLIELIRQHAN